MTEVFILAPGESFIQCPYNTAHQITNARLLTHLDKCRKAYMKNLSAEGRQKNIKICRHNALHHVPSPELRFHEERCRDAFSVVSHMAYHNSDEGNKQYEERREQDSDWQEVGKRSSRKHSNKNHDMQPVSRAPTTWAQNGEDWEAECTGNSPGYDPEIKLKSEVIIYNPSGLTKSERKQFRNEVRQKAAKLSLKGQTQAPVQLPTASNFDIIPNIKKMTIKDEKVKANDDAEITKTPSQPTRDINSNYDCRPLPSLSSSSSRPDYCNEPLKPTQAKPKSTCVVDRMESVKEDYYPDSDDFEGIDPFIM